MGYSSALGDEYRRVFELHSLSLKAPHFRQ